MEKNLQTSYCAPSFILFLLSVESQLALKTDIGPSIPHHDSIVVPKEKIESYSAVTWPTLYLRQLEKEHACRNSKEREERGTSIINRKRYI